MTKTNNTIWKLVAILFLSCFIYSCEKVFEFSPYQADVDSEKRGTNAIQINKLQKASDGSNKITFATISDPHYHYTNLGKIVDHINSDPEIEFLMVVGDIADQGLQKEFELYYNIMEGLNKPYISITGNHDYRSNGNEIYKQMFGPTNFNFIYKKTHFVCFDNTFWENENTIPDFDWLDNITSNYSVYNYQVVVAHLPPFSDQFTPETEAIYVNTLYKNKVNLSIHGHAHAFYYGNYYKDSVAYLSNEWPKEPVYVKITIENNNLNIDKIEF